MKKEPQIFLEHILESIKDIEEYTKDKNLEIFKKEKQLADAVIRKIEIIGEAVKNLPQEFINKHSDINWKDIASTRDKLIHHYFGVDLDIVWGVVEKNLPKLKEQIKTILNNH